MGGCPIAEVRKINPEDVKVELQGEMSLNTFVEKVHAREGIAIPQIMKARPSSQIPLKDQIFHDPDKPISPPTMHHNFSIIPELSTANIIAEQMSDPTCKPIIQHFVSQPNNLNNDTIFQGFTMKAGILLKILDTDKPIDSSNTRIVVPDSLQLALTATYHVAMGHMHARNLYKIISAFYFSKSLRKTVDKLTSSCAFCSMYKISQLRKCPLSNFQLATFPTEIYGMDHFFLSKRQGFSCVLLVVDIFSHFTFAFTCRDESARSVCNHLESIISVTGAPKIVKSDNSLSLLCSKAVSQTLERYKVEHLFPSPQRNSQTQHTRYAPTSKM